MRLFTIGYEGEPQAAVIGRLRAAGVSVLADVRAVAASRRAGFSKTVLGSSLAEAGIRRSCVLRPTNRGATVRCWPSGWRSRRGFRS